MAEVRPAPTIMAAAAERRKGEFALSADVRKMKGKVGWGRSCPKNGAGAALIFVHGRMVRRWDWPSRRSVPAPSARSPSRKPTPSFPSSRPQRPQRNTQEPREQRSPAERLAASRRQQTLNGACWLLDKPRWRAPLRDDGRRWYSSSGAGGRGRRGNQHAGSGATSQPPERPHRTRAPLSAPRHPGRPLRPDPLGEHRLSHR